MSPKMAGFMILIGKAEKDYKLSRKLFNDKEREDYCDAICFHCQQSVEKSLKAFLMFHEVRFPKIHDLVKLVGLCAGIKSEFKKFDFSDFSEYGVEIRYEDQAISMEETEKAFETAGVVLDYVRKSVLGGQV